MNLLHPVFRHGVKVVLAIEVMIMAGDIDIVFECFTSNFTDDAILYRHSSIEFEIPEDSGGFHIFEIEKNTLVNR